MAEKENSEEEGDGDGEEEGDGVEERGDAEAVGEETNLESEQELALPIRATYQQSVQEPIEVSCSRAATERFHIGHRCLDSHHQPWS